MKARVKTREQLLATGWKQTSPNNFDHPKYGNISGDMLNYAGMILHFTKHAESDGSDKRQYQRVDCEDYYYWNDGMLIRDTKRNLPDWF